MRPQTGRKIVANNRYNKELVFSIFKELKNSQQEDKSYNLKIGQRFDKWSRAYEQMLNIMSSQGTASQTHEILRQMH